MFGDMTMQKKKDNLTSRKTNPVKKAMDKLHKPRTHADKTKYNRKRLDKSEFGSKIDI